MKIAIATAGAATGVAIGWLLAPTTPGLSLSSLACLGGLAALGLTGLVITKRTGFLLLAAVAIGAGIGQEISLSVPSSAAQYARSP